MCEDNNQNGANRGNKAKHVHLKVIEKRLSKCVIDGIGERHTEKSIII